MERNDKRREILDKLKSVSSPAPSDWREKARWRKDNREWLRIAGAVAVCVMVSQEEPRKYVKETLGCDDEYVEDFIHGKADLRVSEIVKLIGFDDFVKTVNRLKDYGREREYDRTFVPE